MEIPYTVKARPDTGLWNAKIAIWLFLASEVMLFGGLFSAYIFLRVGSDTPWPTHVLDIKSGFLNTLILIFSSITVLQAWLSLKMRKYSRYVFYMVFTLVLAVVFLCIKLTEYGSKFHHYGVRLQDHSILEGHLPEGYFVKFTDVKKITLASRYAETGLFGLSLTNPGSDGGFLNYLEGSQATVKDASGQEETLNASLISKAVSEARGSGKPQNEIPYTTTQPLKFTIPPAKLAAYDNNKATFRDGTVIEGRLEDDTMHLTAILVDLRQMIPNSEMNLGHAYAIAEKADAWRILGPEWLDAFEKHKEEFLRRHPNEKAVMGNPDLTREAFTMSLEGQEGRTASVPLPGRDSRKVEAGNPAEQPKASAPKKAGEEPEVSIAKKDIGFYSNFTPKYHNYYALYFALTSLHGLHILGGAIVLAYFLVFGRKLYEKDPEHLTNRVEVGGLFWHFVDVVWMVLFPVLYLM